MFTQTAENSVAENADTVAGASCNDWGVQPVVKATTSANNDAESLLAKKMRLSSTELKCNWTINLNGHERFAPRNTRYFSRVQVKDYHSGAGGLCALDRDLQINEFGTKQSRF